MSLTIASLPHFLLARGLLSSRSVVAGDFAVLDASRRNRNFKVICGAERARS